MLTSVLSRDNFAFVWVMLLFILHKRSLSFLGSYVSFLVSLLPDLLIRTAFCAYLLLNSTWLLGTSLTQIIVLSIDPSFEIASQVFLEVRTGPPLRASLKLSF